MSLSVAIEKKLTGKDPPEKFGWVVGGPNAKPQEVFGCLGLAHARLTAREQHQ